MRPLQAKQLLARRRLAMSFKSSQLPLAVARQVLRVRVIVVLVAPAANLKPTL